MFAPDAMRATRDLEVVASMVLMVEGLGRRHFIEV
jgi:hypothetical protein